MRAPPETVRYNNGDMPAKGDALMKRGVKLCNLILPIWLLWLVPTAWIFILPANFVIDLTVSALALRLSGVGGIGKVLKVSILRTWLCGFAADFAGTALMLSPLIISETVLKNAPGCEWAEKLAYRLTVNPFGGALSLLWTFASVALAAFVIYRLNYKFCFRRAEMSDAQRGRVSLALAAFTAPWLFFLPASWLYGF